MAVSQAHHPTVSVLRHVAELGHFEDAEVAVAVVADRVCLTEQVEPGVNKLVFHFHDKMPMGEREPCVGCRWCLDAKERIPLDDLSAAMQEHTVVGSWRNRGNREDIPGAGFINNVNHVGICGNGEGRKHVACTPVPVSVRV